MFLISFLEFLLVFKKENNLLVSLISIVKLALKNKDIPIFGDGQQTRTFIYIDDNIETIIKCFEKNFYINDVLNIGSNKEYNILNLAKKIIKLTNSSSEIKFLPALSRGDMRRRKPNIDKMKKVLGKNFFNLNLALQKYINYLR